MSATLPKPTAVAVIEQPEPTNDAGGEPRRARSAETEADRVRLQQRLRQKVKLARRALAAHRR